MFIKLEIDIHRVKRMELDFWQKMVWEDCCGKRVPLDSIASNLEQIEPIFHKPGWYFHRGGGRQLTKNQRIYFSTFSWFENGTEAYWTTDLHRDFIYELTMKMHNPLSVEVRRSIACLMREHLATKQQRELYFRDNNWWYLRALRNSMELSLNRFTQERRLASR